MNSFDVVMLGARTEWSRRWFEELTDPQHFVNDTALVLVLVLVLAQKLAFLSEPGSLF